MVNAYTKREIHLQLFLIFFPVLLITYSSSWDSVYNTIKTLSILSMIIWELLKFLYEFGANLFLFE